MCKRTLQQIACLPGCVVKISMGYNSVVLILNWQPARRIWLSRKAPPLPAFLSPGSLRFCKWRCRCEFSHTTVFLPSIPTIPGLLFTTHERLQNCRFLRIYRCFQRKCLFYLIFESVLSGLTPSTILEICNRFVFAFNLFWMNLSKKDTKELFLFGSIKFIKNSSDYIYSLS